MKVLSEIGFFVLALLIWTVVNSGFNQMGLMGFMMVAFFWGIAGGAYFILAVFAATANFVNYKFKAPASAVLAYLVSCTVIYGISYLANHSWHFWTSSEWLFNVRFRVSVAVFLSFYLVRILVFKLQRNEFLK